MKRTERAQAKGVGKRAVSRHGGAISLLWLTLFGVLFYLASILLALSAEPPVASDGPSYVSAPPVAKASPPRQSWFHRMFHKPTWSEVLEQCESPRDICNIVGRFVGYRTEEYDRWTSAEETWEQGRGDCEDFAIFIESLCHKLGFSATVNLYFPSGLRGEGHAVAVGTWNGQIWMSSNGSYREVESIDDVKESVARMYGCPKEDLWGTVLAHADIERRLRTSSGRSVAAAVWR